MRELWKDLFVGDIKRLKRSLETEIADKVPEGAARDNALARLEESVFWAEKGINEKEN